MVPRAVRIFVDEKYYSMNLSALSANTIITFIPSRSYATIGKMRMNKLSFLPLYKTEVT